MPDNALSEAPASWLRLILSTAPDEETARSLAQKWVEAGHVACVTVLPGATSTYRWQERLCVESECVLWIKAAWKTDADRERLLSRLAADHPYEVPEFLVFDPAAASSGYAAWVRQQSGVSDA